MVNGFGESFFGQEPFGDAFALSPVATVDAPEPEEDATYDAGDNAAPDTYDAGAPESEAA